MGDKFRNRYRISTSRAPWWDYGNGSYFVTICTKNRIHFFGEIIDNKFIQSNIGGIAEIYWKKIPDQFIHVKLGEFVIMPNHMHGIINIRGSLHESSDLETKTIDFPAVDFPVVDFPVANFPVEDFPVEDFPVVETRFIASQYSQNPLENHPQNESENHPQNISKSHRGGITGIHNPMLHQNLSRVIRWYTGRVSYEAHKINPDFNWQKRFNERIIRDTEEYEIKTRYIQRNPLNWKEDEFYKS